MPSNSRQMRNLLISDEPSSNSNQASQSQSVNQQANSHHPPPSPSPLPSEEEQQEQDGFKFKYAYAYVDGNQSFSFGESDLQRLLEQEERNKALEQFEQHQQSRRFRQERQYSNRRERFRVRNKKSKMSKTEMNAEQAKIAVSYLEMTKNLFVDKQAQSKQNNLSISGVDVYFPYKPYDLQIRYMRHVMEALQGSQNALLQSPTGTGKTLCLLASALSWLHAQKMQGNHPKIIYLSRTHTQLHQIQKELRKTCFRPTMSHVGSRDIFCIKPEVKQLKGRELMEACSKAVRLNKNARQGKIKWDKLSKQQTEQIRAAMCKYHSQRNQTITLAQGKYTNKILEIQEFKQEGRDHNFCPYYYPYHMDHYCDLFVMPYNYILDIDLLPRFEHMIRGGVLIFDEAHNVPDASCEGRSYDLHSANIKGSVAELHKIQFAAKASDALLALRKSKSKQVNALVNFFEDMNATVLGLIQTIPFLQPECKVEKRYAGEEPNQRIKIFTDQTLELALYEMLMGSVINQNERDVLESKGHHFDKEVNRMIAHIQSHCHQIEDLIQALKETEDGIFHNMEKSSTFWKKVALLITNSRNRKKNFIENQINHYRLILKVTLEQLNADLNGKMIIKDFTVELRCLVPWLTFQKIIEMGPRSIIFTSGTLTPLDSWEGQLNVQFPVKLVNKHVITQEQVRLNIFKKNLMGNPFDFRFQAMKENPSDMYTQLIDTIFQLSKMIPNGMLVVCPNFKILRQLRYRIKMGSYQAKMSKFKSQIFQERGDQKYIEKFKEDSVRGAILYCVCRGRASEGIDFPDHHCRAVVFIGIPFPNINDPILIERKEHFEKLQRFRRFEGEGVQGVNWDKWYFNGTIRAINQGLGRLIRHSKDYGMLFLLDLRYAQNRFKKALPQWAQMGISIWDQPGFPRLNGIERFYTDNALAFGKAIDPDESIRIPKQQVKIEFDENSEEASNSLTTLFKKRAQFTREPVQLTTKKESALMKIEKKAEIKQQLPQQSITTSNIREIKYPKDNKFTNKKNTLDYFFNKKQR